MANLAFLIIHHAYVFFCKLNILKILGSRHNFLSLYIPPAKHCLILRSSPCLSVQPDSGADCDGTVRLMVCSGQGQGRCKLLPSDQINIILITIATALHYIGLCGHEVYSCDKATCLSIQMDIYRSICKFDP